MKIHEYQAKALLREFDVPTPAGVPCFSVEEAVQAARQSLDLTINQYKAGTVSYLNVVIVQTATLNNERTLVGIHGRQLTSAVTLVKALGGGWNASQLASGERATPVATSDPAPKP